MALPPNPAPDATVGWLDRAALGAGRPDHSPARSRIAAGEMFADTTPPATPEDPLMIAQIAHEAARDGSRSRDEVAALARRALMGVTSLVAEADAVAFGLACTALCCCDAFAALDAALDAALGATLDSALGEALDSAPARPEPGSGRVIAAARFDRAHSRLRQGRIVEAIDDLDRLAPLAHEQGAEVVLRASGLRALCLLERGEPEAAEAALAPGSAAVDGAESPCCLWLLARSRARAAAGELERAMDDLTQCGQLQLRNGAPNPAHLWWRSDASEVALRLGRRERARALAAEELELARLFGSPRALGIALVAAGTALGGPRGRERLAESVAVLRGSEARLELARALLELGALDRRAGERRTARLTLREGCDLAEQLGATRLAARAREELAATGARPRSVRLSGPAALTPSERRTAELAATGMTNREIAAQLYVTIRTVTTHLTHAYQKLGVSGRGDLAAALAVVGGARDSADATGPPHPASADAGERPPLERVATVVPARTDGLTAAAVTLARSMAVLGREHAARCAGPLSGLERIEVERAIAELTRAGVLGEHELWFVESADAAALYAQIPPHERARAHRHAARVLAAHRAHDDEIAEHLMRSEPAGDDATIVLLRAAAGRALAAGLPERAAAYLRRALAEPPDPSELATIMTELGSASAVVGDPAASEDLGRAMSLEHEPERRARVASKLAATLYVAGRLDAGYSVAGAAIAELGGEADPDLVASLESTRACVELIDGRRAGRLAERMPHLRALGIAAEGAGHELLALDAFWRWQHHPGGESPLPLPERGLEAGRFPVGGASGPAIAFAIAQSVLAGETERAAGLLERTLLFARRSGLVAAEVLALAWGAHLALHTGHVARAQRAAGAALELTRDRALGAIAPFVSAVHAEALLERGRIADAVEVIESDSLAGVEDTAAAAYALLARGRIRLEQGRYVEAVRDLRACGAASRGLFTDNPEACAWRSALALAVAGTDRDEALELGRQELVLAQRRRHRRAVAVALRARGLVEGDEAGVELLGRAVAGFASTDARLDHARALTDLGVALRHRNREAEARERLREGLAMAVRAGAVALAARAVRELAALSSELPRDVSAGPESPERS